MRETPKRAAIYARTAIPQEQGRSFAADAQIEVCRQYAMENGYQLADGHIYSEVASGATANRPLLLAMLTAAARGEFHTLLIYDSYRLARNPHLLAQLIKRFEEVRVTVEIITEATYLDMDAWQRAVEIMKSHALYARQARRRRKKQPPIGYSTSTGRPTFTIQPQEADIVQHLFAQE